MKRKRTTPDLVKTLAPNEIFVFGSNLMGQHGAGAALMAYARFNAKMRVGVGFTGQSYAFPTKDENIQTLPIPRIAEYAKDFLEAVKNNPDKVFLLTEVGCGLAGYTVEDIAPLFKDGVELENLVYPRRFLEVYDKHK